MSRHQWLLTLGILLTLGGLGLESATAPAAPAGGAKSFPAGHGECAGGDQDGEQPGSG